MLNASSESAPAFIDALRALRPTSLVQIHPSNPKLTAFVRTVNKRLRLHLCVDVSATAPVAGARLHQHGGGIATVIVP